METFLDSRCQRDVLAETVSETRLDSREGFQILILNIKGVNKLVQNGFPDSIIQDVLGLSVANGSRITIKLQATSTSILIEFKIQVSRLEGRG